MDVSLTDQEVRLLVAERAKEIDRSLTPDFVQVHEDPHSSEGRRLIVEIATNGRPQDKQEWARKRLRLTQGIRDALLARGDERYPLLLVFSRDEWPVRND